jgi:hypothetical protein
MTSFVVASGRAEAYFRQGIQRVNTVPEMWKTHGVNIACRYGFGRVILATF